MRGKTFSLGTEEITFQYLGPKQYKNLLLSQHKTSFLEDLPAQGQLILFQGNLKIIVSNAFFWEFKLSLLYSTTFPHNDLAIFKRKLLKLCPTSRPKEGISRFISE